MGTLIPEYIHIDSEPTCDDIKALYEEMIKKRVSSNVVDMMLTLGAIEPHYRLALNLKKAINILVDKKVMDVLSEGLTEMETEALVELDQKHLSEESRCTARSLLNVKERWILSKTLNNLFAKARASNNYIDIDTFLA